jgi:hypothetical protein
MAKSLPRRNFPMYFKGERQSDEFPRGAWAVVDLMAKIERQAKHRASASSQTIAAALADDFTERVARAGDYARGFTTATIEILAFRETAGSPNLDIWRPLEMELRYTTRGTHPTPGSKLYELQGVAVSVAPDLTVTVWCDDEEDHTEKSAAFLARVEKHGVPISQRRFDAVRKQPKPPPRRIRASKAAVQSEARHG